MNRVALVFCFAVVLLVTGAGCGSPDEAAGPPLPASLKGYELYSWRSQSVGDDWCFTLITGTNRSKDRSEIGPPDQTEGGGFIKVSVCDPTTLERTLARLHKGEFVVWTDGSFVQNDAPQLTAITFPEQEVIDRIKAKCTALGIMLRVNN